MPYWSIATAVLLALTSQSAFATTDKSASDDNEWVDFYVAKLSDDNIDVYSIKRNQLRRGVQNSCGRPAGDTRPLSPHCGTSTVWIKGEYSKNSNVRYRTSLTRYSVKCNDWEYSKDQYITYSSSGAVVTQWERLGQIRAIIPGSFEERVARAHCANPQ